MIPGRERALWLARHVLPYEPGLRKWLQRRPVEGLETDDVVQETYAVLAAMASVEHIASPRAYAFQTAQSIVLRHLRRNRVARIDSFGDLELVSPAADEPSAEQLVSSRQELRRVGDVIAALPAKCREAFTLRKFEGLSQRAVAGRMGISESTVEKHVGRAYRALMEAMKHGGNGGSRASEESGQLELRANDKSQEQQRSGSAGGAVGCAAGPGSPSAG